MFKVKPIYGWLFKYIPYPIGLEFHWGTCCTGNYKGEFSAWRPKWILRWWFKRSNAFHKPYNWWLWNTAQTWGDNTWEGQGMDDLFDQLRDRK